MLSVPTGTRRSILLILVISIISPVERVNAKAFKGDIVFSGNPPTSPNVPAGDSITTIEGDLTIQDFDDKDILSFTTKFGPFALLESVTGSVTIKDLSAQKFHFMSTLKEIDGNLIMNNNPNLEVVEFLRNNVSVNGSIEGKNCPKLCPTYTYLISVDQKYSNLFDQACFSTSRDVDILQDIQIGDAKIIKGSLTCKSATNPKFVKFDTGLAASLKNLLSVESLLLDDCPIQSLSSTFPSLTEVESTVEIINCAKLVDNEFSDWLYKIKTNPANMVVENNDNICLNREHVEEWEKKQAKISKYKPCHEIAGDVDLSKASSLIPGTTRVAGKIICKDIKGKDFSKEVLNFLMNIKIAESLEFIQCEPLVNFKKLFPKEFPKIGNVTITSCPNFEPDLDILELVNGTSESITMMDNEKMCIMEMTIQTNFSKSIIKQKDACGEICQGGVVAYRKGIMKATLNMTEKCDQIQGGIIFEGELPPLEQARLFANIRRIDGFLYFHASKNNNDSNKIFELLPNLKIIDFNSVNFDSEKFITQGCSVMIYDVKEIEHFVMKKLDTINCGESKKCVCIEASPNYKEVILTNNDWPAVTSNQTTVAFYPQNVVLISDAPLSNIDIKKLIIPIAVWLICGILMNVACVILILKCVKVDEDEPSGKDKGKDKGKGKNESREKDNDKKSKEESMAQSVTELNSKENKGEESRGKNKKTDSKETKKEDSNKNKSKKKDAKK